MRLVISLDSIGTSSSMPSRSMSFCMRSPPKMRSRSSCRERKKREAAGVALASGAAAKLVVDAARLVPLGAQDVQAAQRDDLVVFDIGLGFVPGEDRLLPTLPWAVADVAGSDSALL